VYTQPSRRDFDPRDRSIAFLVFCLLLVLYLIAYTGIIQSSDGLAVFATAESFARRGAIDSNQLLWMDNQQGNLGPDGDLYSRKGLGMALLALPLVWLARLWPAIGLTHAALLVNPLLTALTGALLYRAGLRMEWSRRTALITALTFGLATLAWPYSQTMFSDPVCAMGLFGAFYGLLSYSQTRRKRYLLAGGIAWGFAYLARVVNLITLPLYILALVVAVAYGVGLVGRRRLSLAVVLRLMLRRHWRPFVSFLVPVVVAGLVSLWWNWARYGSMWDSGYVETERFNAVWLFGISGLLVGPARGLIWYSPALLLAVFGAVWFWRRERLVFIFALALSAIYVLIYGKWYMWHGGYSWGPRFLVPIVPFLALLAGPALDAWLVRGKAGIAGRLAILLLLLVSAGVQWLGMLVPFGLVQDWLDANVQPLFAPETFVRIDYSPLLLQWQFLTPENIHLAWYRALRWADNGWWAPLLLLLTLGLFMIALYRRTTQNEPVGYIVRSREGLYGVTLGIVTLVLLGFYLTTLTSGEVHQAARRIEQHEQRGDAIVNLVPGRAQEFANAYHGRLPIYGFAPRSELDDAAEGWMARLRNNATRLWVLPGSALPEDSAWERNLRGEDFLLLDTRMSEPDGERLSLYALGDAHSLVETGLGTVFGDPARVEEGVREANGWIRLEGYALTQQARPGGELLLALRWESLRPVDYNYHVFVHLLNANDEKLAQRDGQPVQWMRPTSTWQPGEEIIDRYGLWLPPDLPVGSYTIAVGLYDPVSGQRLPVSAGPRDYAIELGPVIVSWDPEAGL